MLMREDAGTREHRVTEITRCRLLGTSAPQSHIRIMRRQHTFGMIYFLTASARPPADAIVR